MVFGINKKNYGNLNLNKIYKIFKIFIIICYNKKIIFDI